MSKTAKIITGLGVLAGISYLGNRKMKADRSADRAGRIGAYLKGMKKGFVSGFKSAFRFGRA
jgi:hypothetical protein